MTQKELEKYRFIIKTHDLFGWKKRFLQELEVLEDKICINALEKAKVEEMFSWIELTDEQIILTQKVCALYTKFATELLEVIPISMNRDHALKALLISQHHSLNAIALEQND